MQLEILAVSKFIEHIVKFSTVKLFADLFVNNILHIMCRCVYDLFSRQN
jgi:hypothetical protein